MSKQDDRIYQEKEKFIELLKQGKNRIEAAEVIGHKEAWACRTIKKIRETEPERLKGTTEEIKSEPQKQDMPQASQKPQTAPEPTQPIENTPKEEKTAEVANTKHKSKRVVMGFKADADSAKKWRLYAEATGQEIGAMCSKAIDEYITNYPLSEEQKQFIELKQKLYS